MVAIVMQSECFLRGDNANVLFSAVAELNLSVMQNLCMPNNIALPRVTEYTRFAIIIHHE